MLVLTCGDSKGQNMCACAEDGLLPTSLSPQQPFPSSPTLCSGEFPGAQQAVEKKEVLDGRCVVSPGLKFRPAIRKRTRFRISRGTHPPRRGIQRRQQTVPTAISATGGYLRVQSVRGGRPSLQGTLLCRSDWHCLRGVAETECVILPVRELCFCPVQCVRTIQLSEAPLRASVPAGPMVFFN